MRVTHLDKSGLGMSAKTACGRNILRTPFSASWADFKQEPEHLRCVKCVASKQFLLNVKVDSKK